jgi:hypothetical protein
VSVAVRTTAAVLLAIDLLKAWPKRAGSSSRAMRCHRHQLLLQ